MNKKNVVIDEPARHREEPKTKTIFVNHELVEVSFGVDGKIMDLKGNEFKRAMNGKFEPVSKVGKIEESKKDPADFFPGPVKAFKPPEHGDFVFGKNGETWEYQRQPNGTLKLVYIGVQVITRASLSPTRRRGYAQSTGGGKVG